MNKISFVLSELLIMKMLPVFSVKIPSLTKKDNVSDFAQLDLKMDLMTFVFLVLRKTVLKSIQSLGT